METEAKTHLAAFQKLAERAAEGSLAAARPAPKLAALETHRELLLKLAAEGISARAISRELAEGGFKVSAAWISGFLRKCRKPSRAKTRGVISTEGKLSTIPDATPRRVAKASLSTGEADISSLLQQISASEPVSESKRVVTNLQPKS